MPHRTRTDGSPTLEQLLALFPDSEWFPPGIAIVPLEEVPEPHRSLLAHPHHMTVALEERHGAPVQLEVLDRRCDVDGYARKLCLHIDSPGRLGEAASLGDSRRYVLHGIMRFHLEVCDEAVRDAVLDENVPLGRILIDRGVMRRLDPKAFCRVPMSAQLRSLYGAPEARETYGRIAVIVCDGYPAIELLEIIAPGDRP